MRYVFDVKPTPAPRQTKADSWKNRPSVLRYRAFCDHVFLLAKQQRFDMPDGFCHITFNIPIPPSWSRQKSKIEKMRGAPHKQRPDVDNLLKAFLDALYVDDSFVSDIRVTKVWNDCGFITVDIPEEA